MDTSDPEIVFNDDGICNHCTNYDAAVKKSILGGETGKKYLDSFVQKIKSEGKGKDYDCIIGVSGGVDSSYVAYKVKELGLRPLAVHLDNGWDSEVSVTNIQLLLDKLDIDLFTYVLDWEEFRDLQLAFLKASTPDSEIPSDHAIVASLYLKARELDIRYIINGYNIRTETHLPRTWSRGHFDWGYIKGVNARHGSRPLFSFPHVSFIQRFFLFPKMFTMFPILNYVDYNKKEAMKVLQDEIGWKYYGGKHYESIYTRFYQGFILPKKFGYDKRRTHFSSLICSGEMNRQEALEQLKEEPYPLNLQQEDKEYVIKKLQLSEDEFEGIMNSPCKSFLDYPSYDKYIFYSPIYPFFQKVYHSLYRGHL